MKLAPVESDLATRDRLSPKAGAAAEPLLTIGQLSERIQASRSKIERDVLAGLPAIDIGSHDPRRRRKRSLRFEWSRVVAWYEAAR